MLKTWKFNPNPSGTIRNSASWHVLGPHGNDEVYQIDISWPLSWSTPEISGSANVIYLVDGNAMFLSATETLRRRQAVRPKETGTITVGIGYPLSNTVFSPRRSLDLTPPCDHYTPPDGPDGEPRPEPYGGADKLLKLITDVVRPYLASSVFPNISFARTALFGHSYGGLFTLHALFTSPASFDVYLAASPSIWWNDRFILSEASKFCENPASSSLPSLKLSFGTREQCPVRQREESSEKFARRVCIAAKRRMMDNCKELHSQLVKSGCLRFLEIKEYLDEDHGSVVGPAISGGISYFLDLEN